MNGCVELRGPAKAVDLFALRTQVSKAGGGWRIWWEDLGAGGKFGGWGIGDVCVFFGGLGDGMLVFFKKGLEFKMVIWNMFFFVAGSMGGRE